jgi:pentatricopeptide repeat protein
LSIETMGLTTATTAMIPVCYFLGLLLLHAPEISQALAPSSRGRTNRVPLKLTLQQAEEKAVGKEQSLLELQEYTQKLLSPENSVLSDFASPHALIPVLSAWAKTESVQGAETAEQIVLRLKNDDVMAITNKHYTIVMDAWGKAGCADKAAVLFEEMINLATDNPAVAPNRVSYNVL